MILADTYNDKCELESQDEQRYTYMQWLWWRQHGYSRTSGNCGLTLKQRTADLGPEPLQGLLLVGLKVLVNIISRELSKPFTFRVSAIFPFGIDLDAFSIDG